MSDEERQAAKDAMAEDKARLSSEPEEKTLPEVLPEQDPTWCDVVSSSSLSP